MFDCLLQDFLIAELQACGLELTSLKILQPYIVKNREYKLKKKTTCKPWSEILIGVWGTGPVLFHILCDLFLFVPSLDIANYGNVSTALLRKTY